MGGVGPVKGPGQPGTLTLLVNPPTQHLPRLPSHTSLIQACKLLPHLLPRGYNHLIHSRMTTLSTPAFSSIRYPALYSMPHSLLDALRYHHNSTPLSNRCTLRVICKLIESQLQPNDHHEPSTFFCCCCMCMCVCGPEPCTSAASTRETPAKGFVHRAYASSLMQESGAFCHHLLIVEHE